MKREKRKKKKEKRKRKKEKDKSDKKEHFLEEFDLFFERTWNNISEICTLCSLTSRCVVAGPRPDGTRFDRFGVRPY